MTLVVALTSADTDGSAKVNNAASRFTKLLNDSLSMDLDILSRGGEMKGRVWRGRDDMGGEDEG